MSNPWRNILQKVTTSQSHTYSSIESHEAARAQLYHEEAIKDANRQIELLRALIHTVDEEENIYISCMFSRSV